MVEITLILYVHQTFVLVFEKELEGVHQYMGGKVIERRIPHSIQIYLKI